MPNKRLLIAGAVVLALTAGFAGCYLLWPPARDWTDVQFDNLFSHRNNGLSRFGANFQTLGVTTVRHWVDDCDKSLTIVGMCYGVYDAFNVTHGAARSLGGATPCQDEAGYRPEIVRRHIRNYLAWFKAHRGYYGFTVLDAFGAVTSSTGDSCYADPRAPEHES